jgi:hypothetical protein
MERTVASAHRWIQVLLLQRGTPPSRRVILCTRRPRQNARHAFSIGRSIIYGRQKETAANDHPAQQGDGRQRPLKSTPQVDA